MLADAAFWVETNANCTERLSQCQSYVDNESDGVGEDNKHDAVHVCVSGSSPVVVFHKATSAHVILLTLDRGT